jgi:thiamine biosynthesis lipoprotein
MKKQKIIMGMPVTINVVDKNATNEDISEVFSFLHFIDGKFSTYKKGSEISRINRGELTEKDFSQDMKKILKLCEETKKETNGYFDININGIVDPSGIVKGYAINESAKILKKKGYKNFYVEIAGDIQVLGKNEKRKNWKVGIQSPFDLKKVIKIVNLTNRGIATSGNYMKGLHIYNPKQKKSANDIGSITIIGPNIYEADRFATAAFAMGEKGIEFISTLKGFEGYMIKKDKTAVFTKGFANYV